MKKYIKSLQEAYYAGDPEVSNEEYDALVARFGEDSVGGEGGRFKHMYRMYSQQKVYPNRGDTYPLPLVACVKTPKLDGAAISILYVDEARIQGNTRGDGFTSPTTLEDWKLDALNIPVGMCHGTVQVTGEVVTTKRVTNERNFASGALQLDSKEEFMSRVAEGGLIFVAYNVQNSTTSAGLGITYTEDMQYLSDKGFNVVTESNWTDCPQDGIVYRLDSNKAFFEAGFTDKFPKGAFAEKEDEEGVWTTLLEVRWETGKTGKVTPTAIFETINIDDANISRATLNNAGYIEAMGLYDGCEVSIIRAGSIIPKVVGVR